MVKIKVGDYIEFRSPTMSNLGRKAIRKVVGFRKEYLIVRYEGVGNFLVRPNEVIRIVKR